MTDTKFMTPWFAQEPPESDASGPSATDLYFYGQPGGDAPQFQPPQFEAPPSEPPAVPGWQPEPRFDVAFTAPPEPAAPAQAAAPWDLPQFDFSFAETASAGTAPQPAAPTVPQGWDGALLQPRAPFEQEALFGQPAAPEPVPVQDFQKKTMFLAALLGSRIGSPRSAPANFSPASSPDIQASPALPDWRNPVGTGFPTPPAFSSTPFQKPAPTPPVRPFADQVTSYASPSPLALPAYAGQRSLPTVPALPDWRNPAGTGVPTPPAFSPTPFQKPAPISPVRPFADQVTSYAGPSPLALPTYAGQRNLPVAPEPVQAAPTPWAPAVQAPRFNPGVEPRRPLSPVFNPQPPRSFAPQSQTGATAGNLRPMRGIDFLRPAGFSPSSLPQPVPEPPRQPPAWEMPWLTKPAAFGTPAHTGMPAMTAAQLGLVEPHGADAPAWETTPKTQSEPGQDLWRLPKELSAYYDAQMRALREQTGAGMAPDPRAGGTSNTGAGWPGLNQTAPQLPPLSPSWRNSPTLILPFEQVGFGELKPYTPSWGDAFAESVASLIPGDDWRSRHRRQDLAELTRFGLDSTWGVGSAASANEAYRAFEQGDYVGGTIESASAILSLIPFLAKPIKRGGNVLKKWLLRPSAPHLPPPKPNYITNPIHPHNIQPARTSAHVYQIENDYISSAIQTGPGGKPFASIEDAVAALKQQGLVRDDYTFIMDKDGVFAIPKRNFVRTNPEPSREAGLLHSAPAETRAAPPAIPERVPLISDVRIISAEEANAPFLEKGWFPPYHSGTQVRTFTTQADLKFARVGTPANPTGRFLVRSEEIAGMTPEQIKLHLALREVPTHIQEVLVPKGIRMQTGFVGPQSAWGVPDRGGIQYQLLEQIEPYNFGEMRSIK